MKQVISVLLILLLLLFISCTKVDLMKDFKDPGCEAINESGMRNICYNNLGTGKLDPSYCTKIENDPRYKEWCIGIATQKPVSNEYNG